MPFRSVNRRGTPRYNPYLQRHHLIPREVFERPVFSAMLRMVDPLHEGLDDFRENGMLLPCRARLAASLGLPLHRGPHPIYNELVTERMGQIEAGWAKAIRRSRREAIDQATMRLALLRRGLSRALFARNRCAIRLGCWDPGWGRIDFSEVDSLVDDLWLSSDPSIAPMGLAARRSGEDGQPPRPSRITEAKRAQLAELRASLDRLKARTAAREAEARARQPVPTAPLPDRPAAPSPLLLPPNLYGSSKFVFVKR